MNMTSADEATSYGKENQARNLNKTPRRRKLKRKKYTPKVIREGKSVRTPKTPTKTTEKPSSKRKYTRKMKKKLNFQETPTPSSNLDETARDIVTCKQSCTTTQCVRRSLNFNSEESPSMHEMIPTERRETQILKTYARRKKKGLDHPDMQMMPSFQSSSREREILVTYVRRRKKKDLGSLNIQVMPTPQSIRTSRERKFLSTYMRRKYKDLNSSIRSSASGENLDISKINENVIIHQGSIQPSQPRPNSRKRGYGHVGDHAIYNRKCRVSEHPNLDKTCSFSSAIYKKRRTVLSRMKEQTSSSVWRNIHVMQNSHGRFFLHKASYCISVLCQSKEKENEVVQANNSAIHIVFADCPKTPTSDLDNMAYDRSLTPEKAPEYHINQENEVYGPHARIEALFAIQMRSKSRRRIKKKNVSSSVTEPTNKKIVHICHTSRNNDNRSPFPTFKSEVMNDIIRRLEHLSINGSLEDGITQSHNSLVPYAGGDRMIVPFIGLFKPIKKRKPRPQVDLDLASEKEWGLLMGTRSMEGEDGNTEEDKEKWWNEQRKVFSGRVYLFIARMRLVLGDRSFCAWKGSVVDSVVGVFLTQNVSDRLSSSAFMSLAARFPRQSKSRNKITDLEMMSKPVQDGTTIMFQQQEREVEVQAERIQHAVESQTQIENCETPPTCSELQNGSLRNKLNPMEEAESILRNEAVTEEAESILRNETVTEEAESILRNEAVTSQKVSAETFNNASKGKKAKVNIQTYDWERLRKEVCHNGASKERSDNTMDSLNYDAVRCASVNEISQAIQDRGQHNILAMRIKDFLNRLVKDHGSIDIEWLRDVPPEKAKEYLLSIKGIGLKSTECVRLLALRHVAFPVDTNVARICVRLGWVPLQPLPESLQLHLLEMYPMLETIQKYLWPRLCKLDQQTLYNLHYMLITFGKVFCTKRKPNCNECPMRGECKHYASAFASARPALPGLEEMSLVSSTVGTTFERSHDPVSNPIHLSQLEESMHSQYQTIPGDCAPIIEEPATPEPECFVTSDIDIEDFYYNDPDEIPTIRLNMEELTLKLLNIQENKLELLDSDLAKALVAITPEIASIPKPKLKNVNRLRTEHQVYRLPDEHQLLKGLEKREPDDPCPYLLAIWTPGETAESIEPLKVCCNSEYGNLCDETTCLSCNSIREAQSQSVRGTILIPCRTANRASFPLNGTYFQVNEVFADHYTSYNPIDVPSESIWDLDRLTVYFGRSVASITKGLTTKEIQDCFWKGFVCVRGFDRETREPKPLCPRLHSPMSKVPKTNDSAINNRKGNAMHRKANNTA